MTAVAEMPQVGGRPPEPGPVGRAVLAWYDEARRDLPWRAGAGEMADPYRVWLSEIMLQQTTVKTVAPYYRKFLDLWPTVGDLAAVEREAVMQAWAGLGYYSRAGNLHACAREVVERFGGYFPASEEALRSLPGIGEYTAAAIAAIAFDRPATAVDGNVERVVARLFAIKTPLPKAKVELRRLARTLTPAERTGDYAQAMMDLGATVCTPRRPSCMICPLESACLASAMGLAAALPIRTPRAARPLRRGTAFLALREDGRVLLRRRAREGLLAGMMEVPSSEWLEEAKAAREALRIVPVRADWWPVPGRVAHTFTHFRLELAVYRALAPADAPLTLWARPDDCLWVRREALAGQALPSVMRKVIAHGLRATG